LPPNIVLVETGLSGETLAAINRTQLTQVLTNLIVNAAHAMKGRGTITVTLDRVEPDKRAAATLEIEAGRPYLTLAVADTGHGMDAATQKRIFEPFFTTKPIGEGTGLGLPVAYGILKSWNGATGLTSRVGIGTVFTLYIPIVPAAAPPDRAHVTAVAAWPPQWLKVDEGALVYFSSRPQTSSSSGW
jgi:signal transduction histidine kinase